MYHGKGSSPESALDCTNLVKDLLERGKKDSLLHWDYENNSDGALHKCFITLKLSFFNWLACNSKVVILDTKHGTNTYGMYLALFTTIKSDGVSCILCAGLIQNQDEETFKWLYKNFEKAFSRPKVIFTDGDQAMAAAITTQWPGTKHLLCTFHLWKNFYTHFSGSSKTNEGWNKVATLWWRLCKYTDDEFRDQFSNKWSEFCELVETECSPEVYEKNKEWLDEMHSKCHQWAACHTWQHTTYGIHSTSRAEAMNSSVSFFCSKHSLVSDLVKDLEDMSENQHQKSFRNRIKEKLGSTIGYGFNVRKSVENWVMQYTSYAKRLILAQWSLSSNYDISDPEDGGENYIVTYSQEVVEEPNLV